MTRAKPLVKQVDHLILRVDEATAHQLFALFSETLQLPAAWALASYPAFKIRI